MPQINWKAEAKMALAKVSQEFSEVHRSAMPWHSLDSTMIAFDNRALPGQTSDLWRRLESHNIAIWAVEFDEEGGCFVMLVEHHNAELLTDYLWQSFWATAPKSEESKKVRKAFERNQREVAANRLKRSDFEMDDWWGQQLTGKAGDPALNIYEFAKRLNYYVNYVREEPAPPGATIAGPTQANRNVLLDLLKPFGLTESQVFRLLKAVPDDLDWKGRDVRQMYEERFPSKAVRGKTAKKKTAKKPPKSTKPAKKKTKKKPVSKKKVKKTPVTKKKVVKKKVVKKKKKKR